LPLTITVPVAAGNVAVDVPATAVDAKVVVPDVEPERIIDLANVVFCEVSTVIAVVPADCKVSAVAAALESELIVGVVMVGDVMVGDVPNTLAPVPVIVEVEM